MTLRCGVRLGERCPTPWVDEERKACCRLGRAHRRDVEHPRGLSVGLAALRLMCLRCDGNVVELAHLFGRVALEANGASITNSGGMTVNGFAQPEGGAIMPVEQASLAGLVSVLDCCSRAEDMEDGVIKAFRSLDVVCADHDMTEQDRPPVLIWKETKEKLLVPPNVKLGGYPI